jgi:hypothetical protein
MLKPSLRSVALWFLVAGFVMWLIGPRWPGTYDRLLCGESWSVRATFDDRPICEAAMVAAREECVCEDVRGFWSPFYYLVLIPAVVIHGLLFLRPQLIPGTVLVLAVVIAAVTVIPYVVFAMYAMGMRIPLLMQSMAIAWPQLVLFPAVLETPRGKVVPYQMANWSFAVSISAWAALGMLFAALVQRLRTLWLLIGLALAFVAGVTMGLYQLAPSLGWKYLLEFP